MGKDFDVVLFSCCEGAEEHVDKLPRDQFEDTTFLIPVVLPKGNVCLFVKNGLEGSAEYLKLNTLYEFNHTLPHRLDVFDTRGGCVVIMIAVKK